MTAKDAVEKLESRTMDARFNFSKHGNIDSLAFDLELIQKDLEHLQTLLCIQKREDFEIIMRRLEREGE